jgi:hypothetical protein
MHGRSRWAALTACSPEDLSRLRYENLPSLGD